MCVKVDSYRRVERRRLLTEEGRSYRLPYVDLEDGNRKKQHRGEEEDEGSTDAQGLQRTVINQFPLVESLEAKFLMHTHGQL